MFVWRLRSLNALENRLRGTRVWRKAGGSQPPSVDTIGRVFAAMDVDSLRQLQVTINKQAWRSKAIHQRTDQSYRVAAVDGHELGTSRTRCCAQCLVRDLRVKCKKTKKTRVVREYYHRVVVAQWIGCTPAGLIDLEMVRPKEGEVVAARRLLQRLLSTYSRLIDVISADALYLEAPFIRMVTAANKHVVVVMKQEARELYKDAEKLRACVRPRIVQQGERTTQLWDIPSLSSFTTLGQEVRVVWAEERTNKRKLIPGSKPAGKVEVVQENTWVWVTTLPIVVPATKIQQWGHDRWDLENRGFNELVSLWHMDHSFVHHPNAIEAFLLTLAIAFLTTYLFHQRNLKPQARPRTRLALAMEFLSSSPSSSWPCFDSG